MSASQVHAALKHSEVRGWLSSSEKSRRVVNTDGFFEFLIHGLRYSHPPELGPAAAEFATGLDCPVLGGGRSPEFVWAHPEGTVKGTTLTPIIPVVPDVANENPYVYAFLSCMECLRAGRVREREFAIEWLRSKALNPLEVVTNG